MQPNARAVLIRNKKIGADPLVDKLMQEPESPEAQLFVKVRRAYESPLKKHYIEAALLTSDDLEKISEVLEIPIDVLDLYRKIYYDVEGYDKLSKMELLDCANRDEANLKLWALSQGLDFLAWRLGKQVTVSPVDGLQDLFTTCVYKAKEAMFNGNISDSSKESTKWAKLSMDIARLLKIWVMDSAAAKKDLEIALQEVVPDFEGLDSLDLDIEEKEKPKDE